MAILELLTLTAALTAANPTPTPQKPSELAGLWKAQRWFGPFTRGPLIIEKTGTTYTADLSGKTVPVQLDSNTLTFQLPNNQGNFRGRLEGKNIRGHWYSPATTSSSMFFKYATPLLLTRENTNRWSGQITPFDDTFTFYLLANDRPDGALDVFLRNPERDHGAQIGAERLVREGDNLKLFGKRSNEKQERLLATGTYHKPSATLTLSFPFRGGTYDFRRDDNDSDFYPRGKNPGRYRYRPPLARNDSWPTGTLEEAGIDRRAIETFIQKLIDTPMESVDTRAIHGLLIARRGKLVLEEYFHGEHRDKLHDTRSAAKTLTALVAGAAIHSGTKLRLDTPVYETMYQGALPAELDPRKKALTLEHLLTMSSGYFCDDTNPDAPGNEDSMLDQNVEPDYYRFTLAVPMSSKPGELAVYCSISPNLALGVVSRATGESPLETFDRLLGAPLAIDHYAWVLDPAGHPYGGGSVQFLPRDFMKLGQLMLNGGTWQGRRLLSRDFVERASSPLYPLRNIRYGYLTWVNDIPYKNRTVRAYFAGGAGGQTAMVIRELDLVIVTFGGNYSSTGTTDTSQNLPVRYILPAVRELGDDLNAPVIFREDYVTPYGRQAG